MNRLLLVECVALLVAVFGIAMLSTPVALIVFGVAVIVACERQAQPAAIDEQDGDGT